MRPGEASETDVTSKSFTCPDPEVASAQADGPGRGHPKVGTAPETGTQAQHANADGD